MVPLSHLSFMQCEQVNIRPKKKVEITVSHSVVVVGTVGGGRGEVEGGGGGGQRPSSMT